MSLQPSLLADVSRRARKHGRVTSTSVLAYRETDAGNRCRDVLDGLRRLLDANDWIGPNIHAAGFGQKPTSAELAVFITNEQPPTLNDLMRVRRGLSDLLALGAVEHGPSRTCRISGKKCLTWKTRSR